MNSVSLVFHFALKRAGIRPHTAPATILATNIVGMRSTGGSTLRHRPEKAVGCPGDRPLHREYHCKAGKRHHRYSGHHGGKGTPSQQPAGTPCHLHQRRPYRQCRQHRQTIKHPELLLCSVPPGRLLRQTELPGCGYGVSAGVRIQGGKRRTDTAVATVNFPKSPAFVFTQRKSLSRTCLLTLFGKAFLHNPVSYFQARLNMHNPMPRKRHLQQAPYILSAPVINQPVCRFLLADHAKLL